MPLNLPSFYTRTLSAIVFVIIMLAGLLWCEQSFTVLLCGIQFLCLREYFLLMKRIYPDTKWEFWQQAVVQVIGFCSVLYFNPGMAEKLMGYRHEVLRKGVLTGLIILPAVMTMLSTLRTKVSFASLLYSIGGLLYITFPLTLLQLLHDINMVLPLVLIILIWINDTMAYLVGSFMGRTPLSSISPHKTWEGTIGGAILTVAVAVETGMYLHNRDITLYVHIHWLPMALCAAVAGTFGDLLESKLKRLAGVKDSGNIMPGHGGALDRFDSLMVATPFAFACYMLLSA